MGTISLVLIFAMMVVMCANTLGIFLIAKTNQRAVSSGVDVLDRLISLGNVQTKLQEYTNRIATESRVHIKENAIQISNIHDLLLKKMDLHEALINRAIPAQ